MLNIVLEGPKGSGKSTIANHFIEKDFKYFHSSSETTNDLKYHMDLLQDYGDKPLEDIYEKRVIDRFSIGELIYPRVYDRESKLTIDEFYETVENQNTIYVILYSSNFEYLRNRIENRGRNTHDEEEGFLKLSNEMFRIVGNALKETGENILLFDISVYTSEEIIKQIEELDL